MSWVSPQLEEKVRIKGQNTKSRENNYTRKVHMNQWIACKSYNKLPSDDCMNLKSILRTIFWRAFHPLNPLIILTSWSNSLVLCKIKTNAVYIQFAISPRVPNLMLIFCNHLSIHILFSAQEDAIYLYACVHVRVDGAKL